MSRIRITGVLCPACHEWIWSRGVHDHRSCKCNKTSVDGGREYLRIGGLAAGRTDCTSVRYLEARDARVWRGSDGRYLTHAEMTIDHLKNCIAHLHDRIDHSIEHPSDPLAEKPEELRKIIDEMKEELIHRGIYNIPREVH